MSFEYLIARRYISQKKETGFITLITYISIVGLTIGIASLIITLGILNGFERAVKEKILSFQSHLRVDTFHNNPFGNYEEIQNRLLDYPEIDAVAPFIEEACIIRFGSLEDGVIVRGVDLARMEKVVNLDFISGEGSIDLGENSNGVAGALLGADLAERFAINRGDIIILAGISGFRDGIVGIPRRFPYEVRGLIDTGLSEYDNLFAMISIPEAQSLFNMQDEISGIDIRLHDINLADSVHSKVNSDLSYPFFSRTWFDMNATLFEWLRVQRLPILIAFGLIFLVGAINLVSTLILIVIEKQKDIGILKSMGATSGSVVKVFFIDGAIIWGLSTVFGTIIALVIGYAQNTYNIISLSKEVYYISTFPIDLHWQSFIRIGFVALVLCAGATIYPAWKASTVRPAEAIRMD